MRKLLWPALLVGLLTPALFPQQALADKLPADTLLYLDLPDIPGLCDGLESSAMGQIYHDAQIQEFLAGVMPLIQQGLVQAKGMAASMGAPPEILDKGSIRSLAAGLSLNIGPQCFEAPPDVVAGVQLSLANADLAGRLFGWIAGMIGEGQVLEGEHGGVLRLSYDDEEQVEIRHEGSAIVFWAQIGEIGVASGGSLSSAGGYTRAKAHLVDASTGVFAFLNMEAISRMCFDMAKHIPEPGVPELLEGILDKTGLELMGPMALSSGWRAGRSYTEGFMEFKPGWEKMHKPTGAVDLSLLGYVPSDATAFSLATGGDSGVAVDMLQGICSDVFAFLDSRDDVQVPADHPVRSWLVGERREVLAAGIRALGPRTFSYSVTNPNNPMGGSSQGGTFIEVRDVAAARRMFSGFIPELSGLLAEIDDIPIEVKPKNVSIREKGEDGKWTTIEGPEYYTVRILFSKMPGEARQLGMMLGAFQPSWGVSDDGWLVFHTSPAGVRRVLGKGVPKAEETIRENAEVAAFLNRLPKGALSASWSDPRPGVTGAVTLAKSFLPMISMQVPAEQLPVDMDKFPDPEAFTAHLVPTESWSWVEGDVMHFRSSGSFQLADLTLFGGAAAASAAVFAGMRREEPVPPGAHAEVVPEEAVLTDVSAAGSEHSNTLDELGRLQTGVLVYELENSSLPASLQALTQSHDNYPNGYLPQPARGIQPDGWGNEIVYNIHADGTFSLYSKGPNGADESGGGDDVSID